MHGFEGEARELSQRQKTDSGSDDSAGYGCLALIDRYERAHNDDLQGEVYGHGMVCVDTAEIVRVPIDSDGT